MGDILEFPSQQAQGMAFLERELRQLLATKGADDRLIDFAVEQLTGIYGRINLSERYGFSVHLPDGLSEEAKGRLQGEINAGLESIRRENHALLLELVAQLVLAEVRLFQQQRQD